MVCTAWGTRCIENCIQNYFPMQSTKTSLFSKQKSLGFCGPLPLAAIWWSECTFSGSRQWAAKYPTVGWKRRMEIQLEVLELLFSKRHTNWSTSIPQPHPLDIRLPMENKVLTKTKTLFFLAPSAWQTLEETYGAWIMYMWKLHKAKDRNLVPSFLQMQFRTEVLANCWCHLSKDMQPPLGSAKDDVGSSQTMVDGTNHNHVVVHIEMQK